MKGSKGGIDKIEITGKKFSALTAQWPVGRKRRVRAGSAAHVYWLCLCECGNLKVVAKANLLYGHVSSCGCYTSRLRSRNATKHGHAKYGKVSSEYSIWHGMHARCLNTNLREFKYYGARGITVCDRWTGENGFVNFLADMGSKPTKHSLDRIDTNGNYEPSNCRWATSFEQIHNRRRFCLDRFSSEMLLEELKRREVHLVPI